MKKFAYVALVAAVALSLGCAITNYPVMFDTRGADEDMVVDSFYDKAYIIPTSQVATSYDDGSDELYTQVAQTWAGDQKLYTFNNFDPTGLILFLDQTYCDPTRQSDCAAVVADNPDLPEAYSFGSSPINNTDDPFDYTLNSDCSGARSLSLLISYTSRVGECGSGVWADKQGAAAEFAALETSTFRGQNVYSLPIDGRNTSVQLSSHMTGATSNMPIYGRFNAFIDEQLRTAIPVTSNAKFQANWFANWVAAQGPENLVTITYNGLEVELDVNGVNANIDRF